MRRDIQVRIAAKDLDKAIPGWAKKIDLEILNMNDLQMCVLGQLFGRWGKAPNSFKDIECFCGELDGNSKTLRLFSRFWRNEITKRIK